LFCSMKKTAHLFLFLLLIVIMTSCHKDPIITDNSAKISFSKDSVLFDTVFVKMGSTTKQIKVYNKNNKKIVISSIQLTQASNSMFRLNVNGSPGKIFKDVEVPAKDSIFIFIEVTVDPGNVNNPFIVADAIEFQTNGNKQQVNLVAYGQNAHYIRPTVFPANGLPNYSIITCDTTWGDNLPHIIYGFAVVNSDCRLTIGPGAKIYFYQNSGLWVFKNGALTVSGTKEAPVLFQGVRRESEYKESPGQWDRIWINESSRNSSINYAIIKNGFIGIQAEALDLSNALGNTLTIKNTIIKNMSGWGVLSRVYNITGKNLVVSNCGTFNLSVTGGGTHEYKHCTFANFWAGSPRKTPAVSLSNYFVRNNTQVLNNLTKALFGNCIIYGNADNEIGTDFLPNVSSNYTFDHCILKIDPSATTGPDHYTNILKNTDFPFKSNTDYSLKSNSPAIDYGLLQYGSDVPFDILSIQRNAAIDPLPDLGAYEFRP
jgi:hypothetical protein